MQAALNTSGQEVGAAWTVDNPEGVDLVYTLELFDGQDWKTVGENLTARELGYIVEDYITQTDQAQFAVTGYYDSDETNKVYSEKFIIDNVAPADTQYDVDAGDGTVIVTLGDSDDLVEYEYLYSVDGGSELFDVNNGQIEVGEGVKTITIYARDELGNLVKVRTITIEDELVAQGILDTGKDDNGAGGIGGYWYLLIAGLLLILLILFAVLYKNIIFEFTYEDGTTKRVAMYKRHSEDGISVKLKERHFEGAASVIMTMKEGITKKMQGNSVKVNMDDIPVKDVQVPENADGRFEDTIA